MSVKVNFDFQYSQAYKRVAHAFSVCTRAHTQIYTYDSVAYNDIWKYGKQFTCYDFDECRIKCTNQLSHFTEERREKKSSKKEIHDAEKHTVLFVIPEL